MTKKATQTKALLDTTELYEIVIDKLTTESGTPYEVCKRMGLHWGGLLAWVNQDESRVEKFKFAMEVRAHLLAEDALNIADGAKPKTVNVAKLRVETRKWMASRFNPKWFGEKQEVSHSGTVTNLFEVLSSLPRERDVTPESARIGGNQSPELEVSAQESAGSSPVADAPFKNSPQEIPEKASV